jgi:CRP-like cAMP-binding protein
MELGLPRASAHRLSLAGTPLDLPAGAVLVTEGERGDQAFLLVAGAAEVRTADRVITIGPGAVVGELATLDPTRTRNATVVAATELEVLVYDVRTFRSLAGEAALRPHLVPERSVA